MKAITISKRDVMKRAWNLNKGYYSKMPFWFCLRRAWEIEKQNIAYRIEEAERKASYSPMKELSREENESIWYEIMTAKVEREYGAA